MRVRAEQEGVLARGGWLAVLLNRGCATGATVVPPSGGWTYVPRQPSSGTTQVRTCGRTSRKEGVGRRTFALAMARVPSWTKFWGWGASRCHHRNSKGIRVYGQIICPARTLKTRANRYLRGTCAVLHGACAVSAAYVSQAIVPHGPLSRTNIDID